MNDSHIPGPWIIDRLCSPDLPGHICISTGDGISRKDHHIAFAQVVWQMEDDKERGTNSPMCEATARLIASAPELKAQLEEAQEALRQKDEQIELYAAEMAGAREDGWYSASELFDAYKKLEAKTSAWLQKRIDEEVVKALEEAKQTLSGRIVRQPYMNELQHKLIDGWNTKTIENCALLDGLIAKRKGV
jgi:hypothetical protein